MAHKIPPFNKCLPAQLTFKTVSCCAFLCRSMIKCFPAFITCALLAPFDVVFIVFLAFELSATCFALALCKDPSIKVLSTIVPFVSSPKNWTLLVTCPMYDVI